MEADKVYKEFVELAKFYLLELDYYGRYQFTLHPVADKWSMGQLYDALIHGISSYHLKNINDCLDGVNGEAAGKKNFSGKLALNFKKYPFKVKGKDFLDYTPKQPESPDKIKDDLYKFLKVMNKTASRIDEVKKLDYTVKHPNLGMLNALEWFRLINFYYKEQLKLKKLLDPKVRSFSKELASEN